MRTSIKVLFDKPGGREFQLSVAKMHHTVKPNLALGPHLGTLFASTNCRMLQNVDLSWQASRGYDGCLRPV